MDAGNPSGSVARSHRNGLCEWNIARPPARAFMPRLARVQAVAPQATDLAWANRDFLIRVCRFLVRNAGIDQFLDLGSGLRPLPHPR
ncbi:SAM-dependent methyltransferase [Nocardia sp.]|uniref:SAM-dependent methyltransferase n=1 Tax=Nocardia sp. TaxID=1821 RepID=UPI002611DF5B|nr:SAM-dependent methyltransferase [Nocardia sp.]